MIWSRVFQSLCGVVLCAVCWLYDIALCSFLLFCVRCWLGGDFVPKVIYIFGFMVGERFEGVLWDYSM